MSRLPPKHGIQKAHGSGLKSFVQRHGTLIEAQSRVTSVRCESVDAQTLCSLGGQALDATSANAQALCRQSVHGSWVGAHGTSGRKKSPNQTTNRTGTSAVPRLGPSWTRRAPPVRAKPRPHQGHRLERSMECRVPPAVRRQPGRLMD